MLENGLPTAPIRGTKFVRTWFAKSADLQPSGVLKRAKALGPYEPDVLVAPWGIHWYTPAYMVTLFTMGVSGAAAHHIYYTMLDKTVAGTPERQEWVNRIGTALAFLVQATLVTLMGISRIQWLWVTLRKQFMTLEGIDAMFGVTSDPLFFFTRDMLLRAKSATLMAIVIWVFPIAAIFTPGTISVVAALHRTVTPCTVPTIKFPYDTDPASTTFWELWGSKTPPQDMSDWFQRVETNPNSRARSVARIAASSGQVAAPINFHGVNQSWIGSNLNETCGDNCDYQVSFLGPSIKCTGMGSGNETGAPWDTEILYTSEVNLTVFRAERSKTEYNILWIYNYEDVSVNGSQAEYAPFVYSCQNSVAQYFVRMGVNGNTFRDPIIEGVHNLYQFDSDPPEETGGLQSASYVANWVVFDTLVQVLTGDMTWVPSKNASKLQKENTQIDSTPLISSDGVMPVAMIGDAIEGLAQKMAVSLLSDDYLYYKAVGNTTCYSAELRNIYHYHGSKLLSVYCIAIAVTVIMAALGFVSLAKNGVAYDVNFSTIMLTTRNPTLDLLTAGACLGGNPLPKELVKVKLKFGELAGQRDLAVSGIGHIAVGVEGEVMPIRKGARYS